MNLESLTKLKACQTIFVVNFEAGSIHEKFIRKIRVGKEGVDITPKETCVYMAADYRQIYQFWEPVKRIYTTREENIYFSPEALKSGEVYITRSRNTAIRKLNEEGVRYRRRMESLRAKWKEFEAQLESRITA